MDYSSWLKFLHITFLLWVIMSFYSFCIILPGYVNPNVMQILVELSYRVKSS